jgi:hypothetical protein
MVACLRVLLRATNSATLSADILFIRVDGRSVGANGDGVYAKRKSRLSGALKAAAGLWARTRA